jgi:hypothetical protein
MKKQLIATIVGGLILFFWQFLSWGLLNFHRAELQYTPNQDKIIEVLSQNLTENGGYMVPMPPPGGSHEEHLSFMEKVASRPWALISYHKNHNTNMGLNMLRGFSIDLVTIFLLVWLLLKFANLDFRTTLLASLSIGVMAYLTIPYLNSIWFESTTLAYLVDLVGQWGLVGVWLGWWLTRD